MTGVDPNIAQNCNRIVLGFNPDDNTDFHALEMASDFRVLLAASNQA